MVKERLKELVRLAAIDNKVAEKEARFIQMIGQANGVEKGDIDAMLLDPEPVIDPVTLTADQKFEHLYHLVQLMKIDGQVFKSEIVYAEDIAQKLGYKKGVVGALSSKIFSDPSITSDRDELKKRAQKFLS